MSRFIELRDKTTGAPAPNRSRAVQPDVAGGVDQLARRQVGRDQPRGPRQDLRAIRHRARRAWAPSLTRRIARNRVVGGVAVVLLSALVIIQVEGRWSAAVEAQQSWGAATSVLLVREPVLAGDPVLGSLELVDRPAAMVPDGAVAQASPGARAAVDLVAGEIVLADRLVAANAAMQPLGTVAVTVPVADAAPHIEPGDVVDLWAGDRSLNRASQLVEAVVVLAHDDGWLTVAVPETDMASVAVAAFDALTVARR